MVRSDWSVFTTMVQMYLWMWADTQHGNVRRFWVRGSAFVKFLLLRNIAKRNPVSEIHVTLLYQAITFLLS